MDQHRVWETIAESFDASRDRQWPHVLDYLARTSGQILDLMAGNGRHLATSPGHEATWFDWTRPLAAEMGVRYPEAHVVIGDATKLPFANESYDGCTYVAGLHGIPTAEGRAESVRELYRVLKSGGTAQITVWSRHAPKFKHLEGEGSVDANIPWKSGGHDESRYYRLYNLEDLQAECEAAGFSVTRAEHIAVVAKEGWDNEMVEVIKP